MTSLHKNILQSLDIKNYNNDIVTQKYIEEMLYQGFENIFKEGKNTLIKGVNKDLLNHTLHEYIISKTKDIMKYISKLDKIRLIRIERSLL